MIKYLSLCLFFLAVIQRTVATEDENQRYLRHKRSDSRSQSIAAIASAPENAPLFSTLVSVLEATRLDRALDCRWSRWCSKYTVFAPTNAAFQSVADADSDFFKALTSDADYAEHLKQLLLFHVVKGSVESSDIKDGPVKSQAGEELELSTRGGIKVDQANVIDPFDVKANNGRIHTIDSVLLPSFITDNIPTIASENSDFSTLVQALVDTSLDKALAEGKFTVFAPTNEAFAKLAAKGINLEDLDATEIADILKYHVVEGIVVKKDVTDGRAPTLLGEDIRVSVQKHRKGCDIKLNSDINIVATDVLARNGVIHVIDEVLIPPSVVARAVDLPSIVDVASTNPDFSILFGAIKQFPEIVQALTSGGPFTVFAPTNAAFKELGLETVNKLAEENPEALADILMYHVLSGAFFSTDLPDSALVDALNGKGIAVDARDGVQLNDNTHVIKADIETSDGVIHVIDKVLLPPENLVEVLKRDGRFGTLLTAVLKVPGLAETLATTSPLTIFAPTDKAFSKIPKATLNALLDDEPALANVLQYHVIGDYVPAQALEKTLPTLAKGESIRVRAWRYRYWWRSWRTYLRVTLNSDVHVEEVDTLASNGVIHVIDGVLLP